MTQSVREWTVQGAYAMVRFTSFADADASPAATDLEIERVEAEVGRRLPPDYRQYLQTINGGEVDPRGIAYRWTPSDIAVLNRFLSPLDDIITEPVCLIDYFYSAGHQGSNFGLSRALQNVIDWAGRPGLLPIASTSIGDYIVMDLNDGPAHGSVHYMTIHGVAELDGTGIENPLGFIAPSFSAFTKLFFDLDAITKAQVAALMGQRR